MVSMHIKILRRPFCDPNRASRKGWFGQPLIETKTDIFADTLKPLDAGALPCDPVTRAALLKRAPL